MIRAVATMSLLGSLLVGSVLGCDRSASPSASQQAAPQSANAIAAHERPSQPVVSSELQQATLNIEGMVCQGCAQAVKEALERVAGVASVTTDFESNTAIVMFDPGKTSVDTLAVAVEGVDRGSAPTFVVTSKRTE